MSMCTGCTHLLQIKTTTSRESKCLLGASVRVHEVEECTKFYAQEEVNVAIKSRESTMESMREVLADKGMREALKEIMADKEV